MLIKTPVASANHYLSSNDSDYLFKRLLRTSFHKPRDLLTFVRIARRILIKSNQGAASKFESDIAKNSDFTKDYSDYLLGEVRNYSAFYMEQQDFTLFIKFFQYLDGKGEFSFDDFSKAFNRFKDWIRGEEVRATEYLRDAEALLQFFYDVNLVGYRENMGNELEPFFHFSFRERSLNNLAPKVKTTGILMVNSGVSKALDIGMRAAVAARSVDRAPRNRTNSRNRKGVPFPVKAGRAAVASATPATQPAKRKRVDQRKPQGKVVPKRDS